MAKISFQLIQWFIKPPANLHRELFFYLACCLVWLCRKPETSKLYDIKKEDNSSSLLLIFFSRKMCIFRNVLFKTHLKLYNTVCEQIWNWLAWQKKTLKGTWVQTLLHNLWYYLVFFSHSNNFFPFMKTLSLEVSMPILGPISLHMGHFYCWLV